MYFIFVMFNTAHCVIIYAELLYVSIVSYFSVRIQDHSVLYESIDIRVSKIVYLINHTSFQLHLLHIPSRVQERLLFQINTHFLEDLPQCPFNVNLLAAV